jgi:endonuclease/exonuclease/phosphatase family metal-dependent hydrolase
LISILTFNAAIKDVRILGKSMYCPANYIRERLEALAKYLEILNADIICLQELFHTKLQHHLYTSLEAAYPYVAGFAKPGLKLRLGNELIILSKFPLRDGKLIRFTHAAVEERLFTSKGMYQIIVELPDLGALQLVNFHMTAGGLRKHPESQHMETIRSVQIQQLLHAVPSDIPAILAGDLNAGPEASRNNYLELLNGGFTDTFSMAGANGITWDPDNPLVKLSNEGHLPPQRIDHIFINKEAERYLKPTSGNIVLDDFPVRLSNNNCMSLSDHYGVQIKFEIT